ncbi:hypothetical protein BC941DRAFT_87574 [Chlamydoabsidia padenii]|nr:hypothetical protein BC941DRAFT_87574 [Chlamydoabsidia padenii]
MVVTALFCCCWLTAVAMDRHMGLVYKAVLDLNDNGRAAAIRRVHNLVAAKDIIIVFIKREWGVDGRRLNNR